MSMESRRRLILLQLVFAFLEKSKEDVELVYCQNDGMVRGRIQDVDKGKVIVHEFNSGRMVPVKLSSITNFKWKIS